jgi:hypothetical protein
MKKRFLKIMIGVLVLFMIGAPAAMAKQGTVWSMSAPLNPSGTLTFGVDGSGASVFGVVAPGDDNGQQVVYCIDATTNEYRPVEVFGWLSIMTSYQTTTAAYCGGTTSWLPCNSAMADMSGVSYVVIQSPDGVVGWAETSGTPGTADRISITTGASNLAMGKTDGLLDLSGVTFPAGSRVYPMFRVGGIGVNNTTATRDNSSGLYAAEMGSPILVILQSGTGDGAGSGCSLEGVTTRIERRK